MSKALNPVKARTGKIKAWLARANTNNPIVRQAFGRGLLVIYYNQTTDERAKGETIYHNKTGFAGGVADFGTSVAEWFLQKKDITIKQAEKIRPLLIRHARQIAEDALKKEAISTREVFAPAIKDFPREPAPESAYNVTLEEAERRAASWSKEIVV